ncbi:MAG: hypothetical protein HFF87_02660 [Oscillibacter sp.]|nr:hypothetical protein [Oscillibacter sp.]
MSLFVVVEVPALPGVSVPDRAIFYCSRKKISQGMDLPCIGDTLFCQLAAQAAQHGEGRRLNFISPRQITKAFNQRIQAVLGQVDLHVFHPLFFTLPEGYKSSQDQYSKKQLLFKYRFSTCNPINFRKITAVCFAFSPLISAVLGSL